MNNIAAALMGELDVDTAVNREALKYAVMRTIMCPQSGRILDIRTAVYFTVTPEVGNPAAQCVDGAWWDERVADLAKYCEQKRHKLEVLDGRVLNARKPRKRAAKKTAAPSGWQQIEAGKEE